MVRIQKNFAFFIFTLPAHLLIHIFVFLHGLLTPPVSGSPSVQWATESFVVCWG
jgi:hypothetical protein